MLRWAIRAVAANSYRKKAISESSRASSKANDAKRKFSYAKREKDTNKKLDYICEGLDNLAEAVSHSSNSIEPLAEVSFVASLLVESIQNNLDKQTDKDHQLCVFRKAKDLIYHLRYCFCFKFNFMIWTIWITSSCIK